MANIRYPGGVPCWVETLEHDPTAAIAFYAALFGWSMTGPGTMPAGGAYYVAQLDGRDVAGIGTLAARVEAYHAWVTHIRVDDVDVATSRVTAAGGTVIAAPFDALPAGRCAVVTDSLGAVFCLWQPHDRHGAQLVNAPNAWAMSVLRTTDAERSRAFYERLFGWNYQTFAGPGGEVTLCRQPGYVGGTEKQPVPRDVCAVIMPADAGHDSAWNVDFWVADTDAEE